MELWKPDTYVLGGAFNCGKGQPGQIAPVSHGCPSALFRKVNVLNTQAEGVSNERRSARKTWSSKRSASQPCRVSFGSPSTPRPTCVGPTMP